jgi:hypothetical protein
MRSIRLFSVSVLLAMAATPAAAPAGEIDKTKPILCAMGEAFECTRGKSCDRVLPAELGAPRFFSIDLTRKVAQGVGAGTRERMSTIGSVGEVGPLLVMQGMDEEREARGAIGWTAALSQTDGGLVLTAGAEGAAFIVFGDCLTQQ